MQSPRTLVESVEHHPALPSGPEERFAGYGVMGVPFSSGYILALRHFPASSVGSGLHLGLDPRPCRRLDDAQHHRPRVLLSPLLRQRPRIGVDGRDLHPVAGRLLLQRGRRRRGGPELGRDAGRNAGHPAHVGGGRGGPGTAVAQPDVPARHGGCRRPGAGGRAHRADGHGAQRPDVWGAPAADVVCPREHSAPARAQPGKGLGAARPGQARGLLDPAARHLYDRLVSVRALRPRHPPAAGY